MLDSKHENDSFEYNKSLLMQNDEVIEMVANTITGGLKGSNDDETYSFFYVNEGLSRMLGYTMEEFMQVSGGCAVGAVYPPDLKAALNDVDEWFSKGPEYKTTYRMRKKDGSLLWVSDIGRKFKDKDGITRINSIIMDIAAEKEAMEALHIERERYKLALEGIDGIMFEYDVKTDMLTTYERRGEDENICEITLSSYKEDFYPGEFFDKDSANTMRKICNGEIYGSVEMVAYSAQKPEDGARNLVVRSKPIINTDGNVLKVIGLIQDITEQKREEAVLHRAATHDALTGLYNYNFGKKLAEEYLQQANKPSGAMLILDLDGFKQINIDNGHMYGNGLLINIADKLSRLCLSTDILARISGDEFFLFLKGIGQIDAVVKAGRILEAVQSIETGSAKLELTCSVGLAVTSNTLSSFEQLFFAADKALIWAQKNGRGCIEMYQSGSKYESDNYSARSLVPQAPESSDSELIGRQLVSFALDIFEKTNNVQSAVKILLGVIGRNFKLERITVHQMGEPDIIWTDEKTAPFICENWSVLVAKHDLYMLVDKQDASGTVIVNNEALSDYSSASHLLITQNNASTVLYAPIFGHGLHVGAISFVNVRCTREWGAQERSVLGEVSRIVASRVVAAREVAFAQKRLDKAVNFDNITGLSSFGRFKEECEKHLADNINKRFALLYIDIQSFKYINEKLGYAEGDNILRSFSDFIKANTKGVIAMTRATADQFVILISADDKTIDLNNIVNTAHEMFRKEENKKYDSVNLLLRTGIYIIEDRQTDFSICIDRANSARKYIKQAQGANSITYSNEIGRQMKMENELSSHMHAGIDNEEFVVYYQPKVRLSDFKIIGAEALVRWRREDGSLIPPLSFIPLFEKNGFVTKLDRYVFMQTVTQMRKWKDEGLELVPFSVNASCLHAMERDFSLYLLDIIKKYDISPSLLEIELTESAIVDNLLAVENMLTEVRSIGIKTSIDDLGAGYSVLNMIMNMPVDVVKLDRDFIISCQRSGRGTQFLAQLITMIKSLDYGVLCEGIETMEQANLLASLGCDMAQGYLFGHPMPADKFESILHKKVKK